MRDDRSPPNPPSRTRHDRVIDVGSRQIVTHGLPRAFWHDIYHYTMTVSWPAFFAAVAAVFVVLNALFAVAFSLGSEPIANRNPPGLLGAFFFSVETLATVGYGDMHPQTLYGHVVATIEIFLGMSFVAIFTGATFARFSLPRARILFARHPVVSNETGVPTLHIRAANARANVILEAAARLRLLRTEVSKGGSAFRKLYDLKLVRDQHPIFLLGWVIMHVIDEDSPLYGETPETLAAAQAALILSIEGVDETTSQTMQTRYNYNASDIRWNERYEDLLSTDDDGVDHMDYTRFHETRPLD